MVNRSALTEGAWIPNQLTRTANTRRSSFSVASIEAKRSVSSMFGSRAARPAKFIPIPIMAEVSASGSGGTLGARARLNGTAEPSFDIDQRAAHMSRPIGVEVLELEPGADDGELFGRRGERKAIAEIDASIAQRKQLRPKQILAPQTLKMDARSGEHDLKSLLPSGRQLLR